MPSWKNEDYDRNADAIATAFLAGKDQGGSSLTDLIEKTAREECLSPEQIRRLTRISNQRTYVQTFEGMGKNAAPDRNVVFTVGDEDEVIRRLVPAVKTAQRSVPQYPELPDAMQDIRHPTPPQEKTAAVAETLRAELRASLRLDQNPYRETMKFARAAEELDVRCKQAALQWSNVMDELVTRTRKTSWSSEKSAALEVDALSLHGADVLPEINALRKFRGSPSLAITHEKVAAVRNRTVAERSTETDLVKCAADIRLEYRRLKEALRLAQEKFAHFDKRARGVR